MTENTLEVVLALVANPWVRRLLILAGAVLVATLVHLLFTRVVVLITRATRSDVDDKIAGHLRGPMAWSVVLAALGWVVAGATVVPAALYVSRGLLITTSAMIWSAALFRIGHVLLDQLSTRVERLRWLEPKTLPLFEMLLKVAVVGGFLYFVCIAWRIPLTSWLTSAGIVGIAVGFAARDTLANLFAGIFIIADAPYKVGDFVVLDQGVRGIVADIGIRSTRLLTRDDVEVTIPNAVIGNAQIVNETGGPYAKMRVRVKVEAAYGSDVDRVEEALLASVPGVANICPEPAPRVRFREFGESGLAFELLAWIDEPIHRGRVLHELNSNVYKAFSSLGIEIPYPKRDVYIKALPLTSGGEKGSDAGVPPS